MQIGVDIGGSLTKVVIDNSGTLSFTTLDHHKGERAADMVGRYPDAEVFATGCGSPELKRDYPRVHLADELTSFCAGSRFLAAQLNWNTPYVLTSFGTGTSIFLVSADTSERVSGTAVGGGTLTGLASLLLGTSDFERVISLAAEGERSRVDLMVSDLYLNAASSPVLSYMTAANFGGRRLERASRADIAAALLQLVLETIALLSIQTAKTHKTKQIILAGSPTKAAIIRDVFTEIGRLFDYEFIYADQGPYFGAMGAMELGNNDR